jgi:lipopolysaccharide biosynthesis regulator YciM
MIKPAYAQEELIRSIDAAIEGENYSVALERLIEGQTRFPDDYRFFKRAGDLYYREGLFGSAREAWEEALDVGAPRYPVRYDISRAYSRLNNNQPAIDILTDLNNAVPEDLLVADDLAWLYYKENQLDAAQRILERTVAEFGRDRDLSMTLATVYAGQFDYQRAVNEYESAIADARRSDDSYFLAVAYYNISILHARFHRWGDAMDAAQRSLEMVERSSGFLIRAELEFQRLNLSRFKADVERAVVLEDTGTLATLSLADAHVQLGDPDRAIAIVKNVIDSTHEGWLYYYGTDPERYLQQLYATAADAWEAGANRDAVYRPGAFRERIAITLRGVARRVRQWYYRGLYRRQSVRVAESFAAGERPILAAWHRMRGSEWFRPLARRYLTTAEERELAVNPAAAIDYELTRAELERDSDRFNRLLPQLTDEWHRTDRLHALHGIYRIDGRRSSRGLNAAAEAWRLHPNSFFIRGRSIPIAIHASPKVRRTFRRHGVRHTEGSPLQLTYESSGDQVVWNLSDTRSGTVLRQGRVASTVNPDDAVPVIVSQITTVQ